ncbi:tyrosine-protein kinase BAZ1B-like [Dendronephthya gigantea]|uniref:tyrosine-protein kinase BAZ1B-like n=1 Tax=Dendronephthya gigantea TaxID=151771 RepID=UPI00106A0AA4|nr:tyrosine-protein kinase BAZ1B-like [Dendronephthya gigantea]
MITLDDGFSQKEKKIVEKNALKKQKTLSQMFTVNTKKSSKIKDGQPAKINAVFPPRKPADKDGLAVVGAGNNEKERVVEMVCSRDDSEKKSELPLAKSCFDLDIRFPLPSPKPVAAPEPLKRHYGDILMVTEFIHFYGNFLCRDEDLQYCPDDLVSGLMNDGPKSDVFVRILSGLLRVLLQDLRQQESSKEFADIGVDLTDMNMCDSTVGELTKMYLKRCCNYEGIEKDGLKQRNLSGNILLELERKDVVNLSAVQKLEILIYMLEQILTSEKFCSHCQDLEETRRMSWRKKLQLEGEIRHLLQEQKQLDDAKPDQKEIDTFLEKNSGDDGDKATGKEEKSPLPESFNADEEIKDNLSSNELGMKEKDRESCASTKRQEMAAKSKAEKEKLDQMRYLSEELFKRRQKIERLKETINQTRDCRRVEALGSDRNHSRYWLLQSHPEILFVEKTVGPDATAAMSCPEEVVAEKEGVINEEGGKTPSASEESWHYYGTASEVDQLILRLKFHDENENALMQKIKIHAKKLRLMKRKTSLSEECPSSSGENANESSVGELGKLKKVRT